MKLKATIACDVCDTGNATEYLPDPADNELAIARCPDCISRGLIPYYVTTVKRSHEVSPEVFEGYFVLRGGEVVPAKQSFADVCKQRERLKDTP